MNEKINWKTSKELVDYEAALKEMEAIVAGILDASKPETIWFLEHPPIYTAGSSAKEEDLLETQFPTYNTGRGGQYTYHGPGQRIIYSMLNLRLRNEKPDIRQYVHNLEEWIIQTLELFQIKAFRIEGKVGIWVEENGGFSKIAALGIRVRKWVTYHGAAINLCPDLEHYKGIVPCGIKEFGVTSLHKMGVKISFEELDSALKQTFFKVF